MKKKLLSHFLPLSVFTSSHFSSPYFSSLPPTFLLFPLLLFSSSYFSSLPLTSLLFPLLLFSSPYFSSLSLTWKKFFSQLSVNSSFFFPRFKLIVLYKLPVVLLKSFSLPFLFLFLSLKGKEGSA